MAFATPYSLLTWSSLEDLNQRLDTPVSEINFRPNLVIGTDEKIPYVEDQWRKRVRYEIFYAWNCSFWLQGIFNVSQSLDYSTFIFIPELGMKSFCVMPNLVIDVWLPRLTQRLESYTKKESLWEHYENTAWLSQNWTVQFSRFNSGSKYVVLPKLVMLYTRKYDYLGLVFQYSTLSFSN